MLLFQTQDINNAACDIAFDVANSGNAMVCGSIPPTKSFKQGEGKEKVQAEIRRQVEIFMSRKVDFLIAEVKRIYSAIRTLGGKFLSVETLKSLISKVCLYF